MKLLTLLITLLLLPSISSAKMTAKQIAKKADDRSEGRNNYFELEMTLIKKNSTKTRKLFRIMQEASNKEKKQLSVFTTPKAIKKTSLLTVSPYGDDSLQWIYLPALKKSRKIATSSKGRPFVGSEIYYEDMQRRHPDDDKHIRLKDKKVSGKKTYVIKSIPIKDSSYGYRVSYVDQKTYIPMKVVYYDKKNKYKKTMKVTKIKKIQDIWTIMIMEVENKKKIKTILKTTKAKYNLDSIKGSMFGKTMLKNAHRLKIK